MGAVDARHWASPDDPMPLRVSPPSEGFSVSAADGPVAAPGTGRYRAACDYPRESASTTWSTFQRITASYVSSGASPTVSVYRLETTGTPVSRAIVVTRSSLNWASAKIADTLFARMAATRSAISPALGSWPGRIHDRAVDRQAVGRREVRERVVERDDGALRLGDRAEPVLRVRVELGEGRPVGGEALRVGRGPVGVRVRERRRDPLRVQGGVRDVHPQVRVGARRAVIALALEQRDALEVLPERHDGRGRAGVLDEARNPVVEAEAVAHDELRLGDPPHVAGRRVEGVHLAALGDEALDAHARPADLADHVREDRRGRDDVDGTVRSPAGRRRGIPAGAARGDEDADGERREQHAASRGSRTRRITAGPRRALAGRAQPEDLEPVGGDPEPGPPADRGEHVGRGPGRRRRATGRTTCRSRGGDGRARTPRTRGRPRAGPRARRGGAT